MKWNEMKNINQNIQNEPNNESHKSFVECDILNDDDDCDYAQNDKQYSFMQWNAYTHNAKANAANK